jgi:uncharacterized protein YsxB (DUF464 family)
MYILKLLKSEMMEEPITHKLDYLLERAKNPSKTYGASSLEKGSICLQKAVINANLIIIRLGGKAGRLGDCIVCTALLEGFLQAIHILNNSNVQIKMIINTNVKELFSPHCYNAAHIDIYREESQPNWEDIIDSSFDRILFIDLHTENDGMPYVKILSDKNDIDNKGKWIVEARHLTRVGIRYYSQHGPLRRYADFIEDLLDLSSGSINGETAQPRIRLSGDDLLARSNVLDKYHIGSRGYDIVCFFQSVVYAKCYELWDEVIQSIAKYYGENKKDIFLNFIVACGPDQDQLLGFHKEDIINWLHPLTNQANSHIQIVQISSLRDLAIILSGAQVCLTNDTGPGHIAGALHIPTITTFLPGNIYSMKVWSSSLYHIGVAVKSGLYSDEDVKRAILQDESNIINSISVQDVVDAFVSRL